MRYECHRNLIIEFDQGLVEYSVGWAKLITITLTA